ncbi:ATP synthase subunit C [Methylomonas sp. LL1]|uniref:ATP synthase subunit C n=1 Tax=Methylomonas sp. LL1 TaxID=2785785 RepID=UPI0018C42BB5|nr:ATP synthase subunit C [Methylomonas sp. LL1]QPK64383.1 ATP synthase subunit C [Methylomonas sp. LL1]CAG1020301.1 V/A-type H+/Na+-transporting ATPase subunit K [Methylococcales bacterium]
MNELLIILGWIGLYAPMALGALGSIIGCSTAGQAAIGAMLDTETGHGRYVGVSAMASSQVIFGIVVMFTLNRPVTIENAPGLFAVGVMSGLALMLSAIYQGQCCASAIHAAKSKPEIFGLSIVPAAIVEGFAVFSFIFALVVSGGIPKG